ncbi:MAG: 23S rRNA (uracil(1939)-C(5))-methyltransferase RlmD [Firmicutes bacterium]|nr:23S rRNA (uracil(1939)-C(5))-methyltransferase RlmD [Bacillota bacterium]
MKAAPVKIGDKPTVKIESISHQGEGVAKVEGYTVFVPFAAPEDVVTVEIISVQKDYGRGLIQEIVETGKRIDPKCQWFGQCGGCNLQHLDYEEQLRIKTETTKTSLERIGGVDPALVRDTLPTRSWNYRNKMQAPVAVYEGRPTAGLYRPRSNELVPVEECAIQHGPNNQLTRITAEVARECKLVPWDGLLRHIVTRHSEATGQSLLVLVVAKLQFPGREQFLRKLRQALPTLETLVLNQNPHPTNVIMGSKEEVIWGPGYIIDTLGDMKFKISARSFWQVNNQGALKIYEQVKKYAALQGSEVVLDVYSGTGSIGLYIAKHAQKVIGIENNKSAVNDARFNAQLNAIDNAEFHLGYAERTLPKLANEGLRADVVILDPPRKGCAPMLLDAVAQADPQRIVYVSCNPATLARDLKMLKELGYETREAQPVDMFPHTSHVETVVLMSRANK